MTCSSAFADGSCLLNEGGNPCRSTSDCISGQSCDRNECNAGPGNNNGTYPTPPPDNTGNRTDDNPFMKRCNITSDCMNLPNVPAGITFSCNVISKFCFLPCNNAKGQKCPTGDGNKLLSIAKKYEIN